MSSRCRPPRTSEARDTGPRLRVLITDGAFVGVEAALRPAVERLGWDLIIATDPGDAARHLGDCDLLVLKNFELSAEQIDRARRLRGVQKLGLLTTNIDRNQLVRRGIPIRTLLLPSSAAVADHAVALLLALTRQLLAGGAAMHAPPAGVVPILTDERHFAYNWAGLNTSVLSGKVLGLIGFGEVALQVSRRARAFGMTVRYAKRHPLPADVERRHGVRSATFDRLLEDSDVVSIHVPQSPQTEGLIGADELARMKPGAFLINTSRGAIVDEGALVDSLLRGHIAGAGLDVFRMEPLPKTDRLLTAPRTVLTPHAAGAGPQALSDAIAQALRRWPAILRAIAAAAG
jgi:phosphoglycerate dehydrogenase-like enzyme